MIGKNMKFIILIIMILAMIEIVSASEFIGESGISWSFDITEDNKTEVEIDIIVINDTTLELTLSEHPDASLLGNYRWKMALCNVSNVDSLEYLEEDAQGGFNNAIGLSVLYAENMTDFGMPDNWCIKSCKVDCYVSACSSERDAT